VQHRGEQLAERAALGDEWVGWDFDGEPVPLMFAQLNGRPIDARMDAKRGGTCWPASGSRTRTGTSPGTPPRRTRSTTARGDVAVVAKMLGHADPSFTYRTYVHPLEQREADLADAMDAPYGAPYDPDGRAGWSEGREPAGAGFAGLSDALRRQANGSISLVMNRSSVRF
jgi:integrase